MQDDSRLPTNESHTYVGRDMTAVYYPIANGHCTWAVGVSEAALQLAGLAHKPPTATHGHDGNTANADAGDSAQQRASAGRETLEVGSCVQLLA